MKRNIILLVDADADTSAATLAAAGAVGFDVRVAQIQRDVSELTEASLDDVAFIVIDYDRDVHGLALGETLDRWQPPRPVILVSSDEGLHCPLLFVGGRARHLIKPVTASRLAHAIELLTDGCGTEPPCCDQWGHPCESCEEARNLHLKSIAT